MIKPCLKYLLLLQVLFTISHKTFGQYASNEKEYYQSYAIETWDRQTNKYGFLLKGHNFIEEYNIPKEFDRIWMFTNPKTQERKIIGKIDTNWYEVSLPYKLQKIDFTKKGIKAEYHRGRGIFSVYTGGKIALYSIYDNKIIHEGFDVINGIAGPPFQNEVRESIGSKNNIKYFLKKNDSLCFSIHDLRIINNNEKKFAIEMTLADGTTKQMTDFKYDTLIINSLDYICAKQGNKYLLLDFALKEKLEIDTFPERFNYFNESVTNYFVLKSKGKYGLVDDNLDIVIPFEYDQMQLRGSGTDKNIIAKKNNITHYFDSYAKPFLTIPNNYKESEDPYYLNFKYTQDGYFNNETIEFKKDGNTTIKYFINYNIGKYITDSAYSIQHPIYNFGNRNVYLVKEKNKVGIVNIDGKVLLPFEYDSIYQYIASYYNLDEYLKGKYVVKKDGKFGFLDVDFNLVKEPQFDSIVHGKRYYGGLRDKYDAPLVLLQKNGQFELYNFNIMKSTGIICDSIVKPKDKHRGLFTEVRIYNKGQSFLVDSVGNKFYDFKNIRIKQNGNYVVLEDTVQNKIPFNILPLASINRCEEINTKEQFALVYCLNKYFVVNKYAEMIALSTDVKPEKLFLRNNSFYGLKKKKSKLAALYDFKGNELGKISKYANSELLNNYNSTEDYIRIYDKNEKQGLVNSKGELILDCIYDNISNLMNNECTIEIKDTLKTINVGTLKPIPWK